MNKLKASLILCFAFAFPFLSSGQVIQSTSQVTLPATYNGQSVSTISAGQSLTVTSNASIVIGPGFTAQPGSTVVMTVSNNFSIPVPPANNNTNPELNWVQATGYDENGNAIAQSKSFFDDNGQKLQDQILSISTGHVLASQAINDLYGHPAINTLPAPIYSSDFIYRPNFVLNTSGQKYNTANFDGASKLNNPDPVDNTQQGTLGWYYSNNNNYEPFVPTTSYPYYRTDFFQDGTDAPARSAGVGDELRIGKGREVVGNTFPVVQELSNYLSIRNRFFTDATMGATGQTSLNGTCSMTVGKDQQGTWGMNITDADGKILMTALPGTGLTINNSITLNNYKEEFDINGSNTSILANDSTATATSFGPLRITGAGNLIVYYNSSIVYQGALSAYTAPSSISTTDVYRFLSDQPFTVGYSVNATITQSSHGVIVPVCENCHSSISSGALTGQDYHYFCLPQGGSLAISGGTVKIVDLLSNNTLYDNQSTTVTLPAGMYKAIAESNQPQLQYSTSWNNISYYFYNQKGDAIATIAPNGTQQIIASGINAFADVAHLPFTSTLVHDIQGRLISSTSTDGGFSEYIYRKDGKPRFSQNAEQRKTGRFSYVNYDTDGRMIEVGEYTPGDVTFSAAKTNYTLLENTNMDGGLTNGTKQDWVRTHYDLPDNSHGQAGYVQDNLDGAISWTENPNAKTWYSYDNEGKITWVIKYQAAIGYKTVDYAYNYLGSVTSVAYQKNTFAESFYHYYTYDADQRLVNVQTSRDGVTKLQQAKYYYYLHGPLKREELGDQLQGIDFTYTAQGSLKAINHASGQIANDPGLDGLTNTFAPDVFGMQFEYFSNDYSRSNSNISSIATNTGQTFYNGNVTGISWQSKKPSSVVSTYGAAIQNPTMYTYRYDYRGELTQAVWGTPNFSNTGAQSFTSSTKFNESGLNYDLNGNILSLQRTDGNGQQSDNFTYSYNVGTNQLQTVPGYASYTYDGLGRLTSEIQADNTKPAYYVQYDLSGKISGVYKDNAFTQPLITYLYDEVGNRIQSTAYPLTGNNPPTVTNYLVNVDGSNLAVYTNSTLSEVTVYGGIDRLGVFYLSANNYVYEIRDNVGSIRVVINRNRNSQGSADIVQYNDYSPFGITAQAGGTGYRYQYQGAYAEKDPVTSFNNFQFRMYDSRIGRWLTADPAGQFYSPYLAFGNNPALLYDRDGRIIPWVACALTGMVVGAVSNIAGQWAQPGKHFSDIKWGSVGIAAVQGGVSGLLVGFGVPPIASAGINGVAGMVAEAADEKLNQDGNVNFEKVLTVGGANAALSLVSSGMGEYFKNGKEQLIRDSYTFTPAIGASYIFKAKVSNFDTNKLKMFISATQALFDTIATSVTNLIFNFWDTAPSKNAGIVPGPVKAIGSQSFNDDGSVHETRGLIPDGN